MIKRLVVIITTFCILGGLSAASKIAEFAAQQEKHIQARIEQEKVPLRRQQAEFIHRQNYSLRLKRECDLLIRGGSLTTEKVEALRQTRQQLVEQLKTLDQQIEEASMEAPEIVELQAIIEANNNRIEALRQSIMPDMNPPTQPDAEP